MTVVLERPHVTDLELISRLRIGINRVRAGCAIMAYPAYVTVT